MSFKKDFNSLFEIRKCHKSETESFNMYSFKWIPVESLLSQIYIWFCIELCRYVGLKNSYKIRHNAKTCWKDSSAGMWNVIMLENIGVRNMQKGTITVDIFLLMNLSQFFGGRVCCCLLAGEGKLRKPWYFHLSWRFGLAASLQGAGLCHPRSGKDELGWRVMLVARAGSAATHEAGSKGHLGLRDHTRRLISEATVFLIHGATCSGFLVSTQNESWGRPELCSGAGWRCPPRGGIREVSAQHPCSLVPPTDI